MTVADELLDEVARRARTLEPTAADIEAILARSRSRLRTRRPALATWRVAVIGLVAVLLASIAVPATRTALGSAVDSFFGGRTSDHGITGRRLTGKQVPRWLASETRHALVVAGTGSNRLIAYRTGGAYCFMYGTGVGECADGNEWARELAQNPVVLRGPTSGLGHPIRTLYGFTRGDVASVRLTFATRPALIASARNGGFAITADARWKPQQLDLLDANGHTITSIDVGARHRSEH